MCVWMDYVYVCVPIFETLDYLPSACSSAYMIAHTF